MEKRNNAEPSSCSHSEENDGNNQQDKEDGSYDVIPVRSEKPKERQDEERKNRKTTENALVTRTRIREYVKERRNGREGPSKI